MSPAVLLEWQCFNLSVSGVAADWKVVIQQEIEGVHVCVWDQVCRTQFFHPL